MRIEVAEQGKMLVCTEYDAEGNIKFKSYWNRVLDLVKVEVFKDGKVISVEESDKPGSQVYFSAVKETHGKYAEGYVEENRLTTKIFLKKKGTDSAYKLEEVMPTVNEFIFPTSFQDLKSNYDYCFE